MSTIPTERRIRFDGTPLSIEDVLALSRRLCPAELSSDDRFRQRIQAGADFLDQILAEDGVIYGVTTGYGDSCTVSIPSGLAQELPQRLYTYHGCGAGALLTREQTRAVLATRLNSLVQGYSGVSYKLLEQLCALLQHDLLPRIPSEGSVGASGDLTPLSYVAAVLCGERAVWGDAASAVPASTALAAAGLTPLRLRPKEGLAIMNGTAVMTGLACLAFARAEYLSLPKDVDTFDFVEGVWVTSHRNVVPVAIALRHTLIELSIARQAGEGQQTKMEMVYHYLTGPRFRQRVQAIVEAFSSMQDDLNKEKKAINKQWAKREEQIERVMLAFSTVPCSESGKPRREPLAPSENSDTRPSAFPTHCRGVLR